VERVFKIFDKDGNNKISLAEFLDTMYQYAAHQTNSEKVLFLFKVYDIDGTLKI
jgi:Ca2+-binding EF-hand superfamily protein